MQTLRGTLAILLTLGLALPVAAGTVQFSDGDFNNGDWNVQTLVSGGTGTGSFVQQSSGGNPDFYRQHTIDLISNTVVAIVAEYTASNFDPSTGGIGAIDYSEDARLTSGSDEGMLTYPLVVQDGVNYVGPSQATPESGWTPKSANGLTSADFGRLLGNLNVDMSDNPDFALGASVVSFGYVRLVAVEADATRIGDIDNWSVTVEVVEPIGTCGAGQINLGCGSSSDVLFVNGSSGGVDRILTVSTGDPLSATIAEPPISVGDGRPTAACVYVWGGEPLASDIVALPKNLGPMCFGPFIIATQAPARIWNGIGINPKLGTDNGPGDPPIIDGPAFEFLSLPNGLNQTLNVTFQGIIEDRCSQGTVFFSVTNGLVLRIE